VIFKGVPGRVLNETNAGPIAEETHIIHYKGEGARLILLFKHSKLTLQKENMGEIYSYFDQTLDKAKRYATENVVFNSCSNAVEGFKCKFEREGGKGRISHGEALALYSICEALGVEVLLKVGRSGDEVSFPKIKCVSVEDRKLIPKISEGLRGRKIGVLIKEEDEEAIECFNTLLAAVGESVSVGFFLYATKHVSLGDLFKRSLAKCFYR
jgi:hypothetical protein